MVSEYLIGLREATWVPAVAIHFGCLVHTTLVLRDGVVHRQEDLVRSRKTTAHPAPRSGTGLNVAHQLQQGSCCQPDG
ncbi:hypothetical protein OG416_35240 [Streptomyces longwoodensis]|uniref:hypothetical protein n=1 Tax=Streptomyces longwoodensis TaxID=68231 RepID=UPI0030DF7225|nr:hypothetical protein OG416_00010 [Streptomyces longwoodensis]WUC75675.1 hypothetical protein OG416_35240 [Streptomyces longwoodensis]